LKNQRNWSKFGDELLKERTMSNSQFTIVLGALRSIEEKLALRFLAIKERMDKLELRMQEIEKNN